MIMRALSFVVGILLRGQKWTPFMEQATNSDKPIIAIFKNAMQCERN
jgi:hypothetical protein